MFKFSPSVIDPFNFNFVFPFDSILLLEFPFISQLSLKLAWDPLRLVSEHERLPRPLSQLAGPPPSLAAGASNPEMSMAC